MTKPSLCRKGPKVQEGGKKDIFLAYKLGVDGRGKGWRLRANNWRRIK